MNDKKILRYSISMLDREITEDVRTHHIFSEMYISKVLEKPVPMRAILCKETGSITLEYIDSDEIPRGVNMHGDAAETAIDVLQSAVRLQNKLKMETQNEQEDCNDPAD